MRIIVSLFFMASFVLSCSQGVVEKKSLATASNATVAGTEVSTKQSTTTQDPTLSPDLGNTGGGGGTLLQPLSTNGSSTNTVYNPNGKTYSRQSASPLSSAIVPSPNQDQNSCSNQPNSAFLQAMNLTTHQIGNFCVAQSLKKNFQCCVGSAPAGTDCTGMTVPNGNGYWIQSSSLTADSSAFCLNYSDYGGSNGYLSCLRTPQYWNYNPTSLSGSCDIPPQVAEDSCLALFASTSGAPGQANNHWRCGPSYSAGGILTDDEIAACEAPGGYTGNFVSALQSSFVCVNHPENFQNCNNSNASYNWLSKPFPTSTAIGAPYDSIAEICLLKDTANDKVSTRWINCQNAILNTASGVVHAGDPGGNIGTSAFVWVPNSTFNYSTDLASVSMSTSPVNYIYSTSTTSAFTSDSASLGSSHSADFCLISSLQDNFTACLNTNNNGFWAYTDPPIYTAGNSTVDLTQQYCVPEPDISAYKDCLKNNKVWIHYPQTFVNGEFTVDTRNAQAEYYRVASDPNSIAGYSSLNTDAQAALSNVLNVWKQSGICVAPEQKAAASSCLATAGTAWVPSIDTTTDTAPFNPLFGLANSCISVSDLKYIIQCTNYAVNAIKNDNISPTRRSVLPIWNSDPSVRSCNCTPTAATPFFSGTNKSDTDQTCTPQTCAPGYAHDPATSVRCLATSTVWRPRTIYPSSSIIPAPQGGHMGLQWNYPMGNINSAILYVNNNYYDSGSTWTMVKTDFRLYGGGKTNDSLSISTNQGNLGGPVPQLADSTKASNNSYLILNPVGYGDHYFSPPFGDSISSGNKLYFFGCGTNQNSNVANGINFKWDIVSSIGQHSTLAGSQAVSGVYNLDLMCKTSSSGIPNEPRYGVTAPDDSSTPPGYVFMSGCNDGDALIGATSARGYSLFQIAAICGSWYTTPAFDTSTATAADLMSKAAAWEQNDPPLRNSDIKIAMARNADLRNTVIQGATNFYDPTNSIYTFNCNAGFITDIKYLNPDPSTIQLIQFTCSDGTTHAYCNSPKTVNITKDVTCDLHYYGEGTDVGASSENGYNAIGVKFTGANISAITANNGSAAVPGSTNPPTNLKNMSVCRGHDVLIGAVIAFDQSSVGKIMGIQAICGNWDTKLTSAQQADLWCPSQGQQGMMFRAGALADLGHPGACTNYCNWLNLYRSTESADLSSSGPCSTPTETVFDYSNCTIGPTPSTMTTSTNSTSVCTNAYGCFCKPPKVAPVN